MNDRSGRNRKVGAMLGGAGLAAALVLALAASPSVAQQKKGAPAAKAAAAPAAADTAKRGAWVKLCEPASIQKLGKDGKPVTENKAVCLTNHERLDANTGMVVVSAAVREVEGMDKKQLMFMVPLGMAIQPGLSAAVYPKALWDKVLKKEKIDPKALKPIELKYSLCHPGGCMAETEATKEMVEQMKTGGGMEVLVITASGKGAGFAIPLDGFATALAGPALDNKEYAREKAQVMLQIRQRQTELMQKYQEEQAKKAGQGAPAKP